MPNIIGREHESKLLQEIANSNDASFVAVYGRRRVGKTHLIRKSFEHLENYIEVIGSKDGDMHTQLSNFIEGFAETFAKGFSLEIPSSWRDAFALLTNKLNEVPPKQKIVVFLDELPWLATPKSKLLQSLDYYWNRYWSKMPNLKLIVCGSAASWMLDNLINAKGGLYNRITLSILLRPFNLQQTESFLKYFKIHYTKKQILDLYMIIGGIPFYLKQIKRSKSVAQNINDLCFREDGLLYGEFNRLYASLFKNGEHHLEIVKVLAQKSNGLSGKELSNALKTSYGGRLSKRLKELEAAGFIKRFIPLGKQSRDGYYRVIDEYSLFYLNWIASFVSRGDKALEIITIGNRN